MCWLYDKWRSRLIPAWVEYNKLAVVADGYRSSDGSGRLYSIKSSWDQWLSSPCLFILSIWRQCGSTGLVMSLLPIQAENVAYVESAHTQDTWAVVNILCKSSVVDVYSKTEA